MTCRGRLAPGLWMLASGVCLLSDASGSAQSAQTAHLVQVGVIPAAAEKVEVSGDHAYLVTGRTLAIFDISNPGTPKREGEYTFPDKIWGIEVVGTLVYAAVDKFGLGIVDVSNASAPQLRGSLKTPGQSKSIALTGSMAMVADHMSGVNFVDVSDPAKPVFLDDFFLDGYARAVAARGPIAAAVDAPTGLYVFDFSKPGKLEPVGIRQSADRPGSVKMSDPNAAPGLKIALLLGAGSLQIYDIADPAAPAKAATFRTPGARAQDAALQGRLAFVADGAAGLQVVDLEMPSKPRIIGEFKTTMPAHAVAATKTLVLVAVGAVEEGPAGSSSAGKGQVVILEHRLRAQ